MKRFRGILLFFVLVFATWCNVSAAEAADREDYTALFPFPLKGWRASSITVEKQESMFKLWGSRLILTRTYSSKSDGGQVTIRLDTEDMAVSTHIGVLKSGKVKPPKGGYSICIPIIPGNKIPRCRKTYRDDCPRNRAGRGDRDSFR
jgi:hypothetical protein